MRVSGMRYEVRRRTARIVDKAKVAQVEKSDHPVTGLIPMSHSHPVLIELIFNPRVNTRDGIAGVGRKANESHTLIHLLGRTISMCNIQYDTLLSFCVQKTEKRQYSQISCSEMECNKQTYWAVTWRTSRRAHPRARQFCEV